VRKLAGMGVFPKAVAEPQRRVAFSGFPEKSGATSAARIAYADAFRAIAILAVVASHFIKITHIQIHGRARLLEWLGVWGVDCFFVLTGYLLGKPYLRAIVNAARLPSVREFFARRLFRIYPLYLVCLVFSVLVAVFSGAAPSIGDVLAHLTMSHGLIARYITQINGPLWTMSVDAQFYVLLPIVAFCVMLPLRNRPVDQRVRGVWVFLSAVILLSVLERLITLTRIMPHTDWDHIAALSRNVIGMASEFAIGALVAFREMRSPVPSQKKGVYGLVVLGGLLFLTLLPLIEHKAHSVNALTAMYTVNDLIGGISAGLLLYGCIRGDFGYLTRVVFSRTVAEVAALSYAIYLVHYPFITHAADVYHRSLAKPSVALVFSIAVAVPIALVAYAGHRWVEKPFLRLRDRYRTEPAG
jgi:peptidoglycan/LPS O-acetylase OafA/YrhL